MTVRDSGLARALPAASQHRWMRSFLAPALIVLLAFAALFPFLPSIYLLSSYPNNIYQYIGDQIFNGRPPYLDIWGNTPPLAFNFDTMGLDISGGSAWGMWLLEFCFLTAFALVLFSFLQPYFSIFPAAVAVAAVLANLIFLNEAGNITEEFGLLLQAILLVLFAKEGRPGTSSRLRLIALGVVMGLSFSLRLTMIGTGLVTILYLLLGRSRSKDRRSLLDLLWIACGVLVICTAWAAYFLGSQSLPGILDQAAQFTSDVTHADRFNSFSGVLTGLTTSSPFFTLSLVAWLAVGPFLLMNDSRFRVVITARLTGGIIFALGAGLLYNGLHNDVAGGFVALNRLTLYRWSQILPGLLFVLFGIFVIRGGFRRELPSILDRFQPVERTDLFLPLVVALACLPIEIILASNLGQQSYSFFVPIIPSLAILLAFVVWSLVPITNANMSSGYIRHLLRIVIIAPVLWFGLAQTFSTAWSTRGPDHARSFLEVVKTSQPDYIVDTIAGDFPLQYGGNKSRCDDLIEEEFQQYLADRTEVPDEAGELYRYICKYYEPAARFNTEPVMIYRRSQGKP